MKLHITTTSEVFLSEKVCKPDLYILVDGKVHMKIKSKQEFALDPYEIFGYTVYFNKKPWVPCQVTVKDPGFIVSIPRASIKSLMKEVASFQEKIKLLEFLMKTVPGVKQLGQASKEKIAGLFELFQFKTGEILIKEGTISEFAYIVKEGECQLVSFKNPSNLDITVCQGLMSKTTSCFNIGVATEGEWVGHDSIITSKTMDFSVIAHNNVVALRITKQNFLENLAKETQMALKDLLDRKSKWRRERKKNISYTITMSVASDAKQTKIDIENYSKNYPIASKNTIKSIKQREQYSESKTAHNSPVPDSQSSIRYSSITNKQNPSIYKLKNSRINLSLRSNPQKTSSELESIIKLYSASTLGHSMVPVIAKPSTKKRLSAYSRMINSIPPPEDLRPKSYAERVRKGRPPSPNPAETWAKQHNLKIIKY
jgi:CRP-like cAMP-binding protein